LRTTTKSEHFQWLKLFPCYSCCGFLTSSQNVLIYTTRIKKVIARLYFFILRSKTTEKITGQKFRLTPALPYLVLLFLLQFCDALDFIYFNVMKFLAWVAEHFSKWGAQVHVKKIRKCLCFLLATVTSQALKYDFITYTPYDGPNYTILDKITPL